MAEVDVMDTRESDPTALAAEATVLVKKSHKPHFASFV